MKVGMEKFAGFLGVFLSYAGSVTAFLIFLDRYFQVETETKDMILAKIAASGAKQEELLTLLILPAAAVMVFFWIAGILIYKLIFFYRPRKCDRYEPAAGSGIGVYRSISAGNTADRESSISDRGGRNKSGRGSNHLFCAL